MKLKFDLIQILALLTCTNIVTNATTSKQGNSSAVELQTQNEVQKGRTSKLFEQDILKATNNQIFYRDVDTNLVEDLIAKQNESQRNRDLNEDVVRTERNLRMYVTDFNNCSISIRDSVLYSVKSYVNYINHSLLNNRVEKYERVNVRSADVNLSSFTFNKKTFQFDVFYQHHTKKELTINYFKKEIEDKADKVKDEIEPKQPDKIPEVDKCNRIEPPLLVLGMNESILDPSSGLSPKKGLIFPSHYPEASIADLNFVSNIQLSFDYSVTNAFNSVKLNSEDKGKYLDKILAKNILSWKFLNENTVMPMIVNISVIFEFNDESIYDQMYVLSPYETVSKGIGVIPEDFKFLSPSNGRNRVFIVQASITLKPNEIKNINIEFAEVFNCPRMSDTLFTSIIQGVAGIVLISGVFAFFSYFLLKG